MFNYLFNIQLLFSMQCFSSTEFVIRYSIIYSIFNFLLNIQWYMQCPAFYSAFNYLVNVQLFSNIQLFIQCSAFSPTLNYLFNFLFNIKLIIHSMFKFFLNSTFLSPWFFWSVTNLFFRVYSVYSTFEKHGGDGGDGGWWLWCGDWSTRLLRF